MVIALDKHKKSVGFVTEKRARQLMEKRRACVYRYYPFSIILKDIDVRTLQNIPDFRIKIDPGSKYTGIAVIGNKDETVYYYAQIEHRGNIIKNNLETRRQTRRNRRSRETWYRKAKWGNQSVGDQKQKYDSSRKEDWLPPSIQSIVDNIIHWVEKLSKLINITECSFEAVRFDTQLMDNPDISGKKYQQGTLAGYELREYLLDKFGHVCQYCGGASGDDILEWEHMQSKKNGGSNSVKNACLACRTCNREKGSRNLEEWIKDLKAMKRKTKLTKTRIECIEKVLDNKPVKISNRYCAWVNAGRRITEKRLYKKFGEEHMECSSGGRTKYNRTQLGLPKDHHYDALCVGTVPEKGYTDRTNGKVLYIKAMGRGTRFRGKINKCGIITKKLLPRHKRVEGFMNGDIVVADVPKGKYKGHHCGRVMTRASGSFDIRTTTGELITSSFKYCELKQYSDGYQYSFN